jgi:predicted XRE-type DNA-binding protein
MDRARIQEGIRRMHFMDVLGRSERSELNQSKAAELLGISDPYVPSLARSTA